MDKTINISISTDEISRTVFKSFMLMYIASAKGITDEAKDEFKSLFLLNAEDIVDGINEVIEELIDKVGMSEHAKAFVEIK